MASQPVEIREELLPETPPARLQTAEEDEKIEWEAFYAIEKQQEKLGTVENDFLVDQ